MWGLEFEKAKNTLICGHAIFKCNYLSKRTRKFKFTMQPTDSVLEEYNTSTGGWDILSRGSGSQIIDALKGLLPKNEDYGRDWTYSDFILAMTFFDKGVERGNMESNKGD